MAESSFYKFYFLWWRERERSPCAFQRMRMLLTKRARMRQAGGLMLTCSTSSLRGRAQPSHPPSSPNPHHHHHQTLPDGAFAQQKWFAASLTSQGSRHRNQAKLLCASCALEGCAWTDVGCGSKSGPRGPNAATKPPRWVRSPLIPSLLSGIVLSTICSSLGRNLGIFPLGCNLITPNI